MQQRTKKPDKNHEAMKNEKLSQNYYANDLRKTSRSRDREQQFQQNFLGVK